MDCQKKTISTFPVAVVVCSSLNVFFIAKGSDFFHTDIVRRLRTGDGVKMTENEGMAGKTAQTLHAPLVRDERWVE